MEFLNLLQKLKHQTRTEEISKLEHSHIFSLEGILKLPLISLITILRNLVIFTNFKKILFGGETTGVLSSQILTQPINS